MAHSRSDSRLTVVNFTIFFVIHFFDYFFTIRIFFSPWQARPPAGTYSAAFKHRVLSLYRRGQRGSGFAALARRFAIGGGGRTVERWHSEWDGSVRSLKSERPPGRIPRLSKLQKERHIKGFVAAANRRGEAVNYKKKTKVSLSVSQIRRIGKKEFNIHYRKTKNSLVGAGLTMSFVCCLYPIVEYNCRSP